MGKHKKLNIPFNKSLYKGQDSFNFCFTRPSIGLQQGTVLLGHPLQLILSDVSAGLQGPLQLLEVIFQLTLKPLDLTQETLYPLTHGRIYGDHHFLPPLSRQLHQYFLLKPAYHETLLQHQVEFILISTA